ncbi:MAG: hypothetical protein WC709_09165 [Thermoleophilia bacterium]
MAHGLTFTLRDVISKGFEARCVAPDGARYLWHGHSGIRTERTGRTLVPTDPAALPDVIWSATTLRVEELDEAAALERGKKTASRDSPPSMLIGSHQHGSADARTPGALCGCPAYLEVLP